MPHIAMFTSDCPDDCVMYNDENSIMIKKKIVEA